MYVIFLMSFLVCFRVFLYLESVGWARGVVSEREAPVRNDERAARGDGKRLCDAAVIHLHP